MAKHVLVVESPAKAKTMKKYLGPDYVILASRGQVRDLIAKTGAVDPDQDFLMCYAPVERNIQHVDAIASALQSAERLCLATDPDREGEAISWHLLELLKQRELLDNKQVVRVVFHEITRRAVLEAMQSPRHVSMELVNAQRARRALDFLVGFNLSPVLWRKIRKGLSAGRVQSPALRRIVEREEEIEAFVSQEFWDITADLNQDGQAHFKAKLFQFEGRKLEPFDIPNADKAHAMCAVLKATSQGHMTVLERKTAQRKRYPAPPFITSTLQQEASKRLGFGTQRTMRVAQQLYEGLDVGQEGTVGLITYMRTDSLNLSRDAVDEARVVIAELWDARYVPDKPRLFKTKSKNAQEAHEAIRPTSFARHPDRLRPALNDEQWKLYRLIWQRALACQMQHALLDTVTLLLAADPEAQHRFRASGSTLVFDGFLALYQDLKEDKPAASDKQPIPMCQTDDKLPCTAIEPHQHFTEPPPRYGEASLVKALEEQGIGRPSTYASIIATLLQREYVVLETKRFYPTDRGRVVAHFLSRYFSHYVDDQFTAKLEDELDAIARGEVEWRSVLRRFWDPFKDQVDDTLAHVSRKEITAQPMDEACPDCGAGLVVRLGVLEQFVGCSAYPECRYTRSLRDAAVSSPDLDRNCPDCGKALEVKRGRYGKFIGCTGYPECKYVESLKTFKSTQIVCPSCQKADLFQKKSRKGKVFYACKRYPDCDYALWYPPVQRACSACAWSILVEKKDRGTGNLQWVCPNCQHTMPPETSPDTGKPG